jgi:hypothetical protein
MGMGGVSCQPAPRFRGAALGEGAALTARRGGKIQADGTRILLRGQLIYDNVHTVNDNPDHPQGGQPKRFTLWEVHPISAIFECALPSNACDPNSEGDWIQVR